MCETLIYIYIYKQLYSLIERECVCVGRERVLYLERERERENGVELG